MEEKDNIIEHDSTLEVKRGNRHANSRNNRLKDDVVEDDALDMNEVRRRLMNQSIDPLYIPKEDMPVNHTVMWARIIDGKGVPDSANIRSLESRYWTPVRPEEMRNNNYKTHSNSTTVNRSNDLMLMKRRQEIHNEDLYIQQCRANRLTGDFFNSEIKHDPVLENPKLTKQLYEPEINADLQKSQKYYT